MNVEAGNFVEPIQASKEAIRQYGDSVVMTFHDDAMSTAEHLVAQTAAMGAYTRKIDAGLVVPDVFLPGVLAQLGVTEGTARIEFLDDGDKAVADEMRVFVEQEIISPHEAAVIVAEAAAFARLYVRVFPDAAPDAVHRLARDNARKIAFQTMVDKTVFTGSDHGSRHILEGDMKFAEQLIASLRDNGIPVTDMDQLLVHQAITDHDLGYASPLAREEGARQVVEDHPLFSTAVISANEEDYVRQFGREGFEAIRYAVLQHSYPSAEFENRPSTGGVNHELIRSIVATADALGVTAETKVPTIFKRPAAMRVLMRMRLALEVSAANEADVPGLTNEELESYRAELDAIIDREPVARRRASFKRAVDHFLSPFIAERAIGQFAGVVDGLEVTRRGDTFVPLVHMHLSRVNHLIDQIFGDKVATTAFNKAMSDFGVSREQIQLFGEEINRAAEYPNAPQHFLHESALGVFDIATKEAEGQRDSLENPDVQSVVNDLLNVSIRSEIHTLVRSLDRVDADAQAEIAKFLDAVDGKVSPLERPIVRTLTQELLSSADRPAAVRNLRQFVTENERRFIQNTPG